MDFIIGIDRDQVTFFTLESQTKENNPVRFVDAFVDHLDLIKRKADLPFIFSNTNRLRKNNCS